MQPASSSDDITSLIRLWRTGDRDAERRLFEIVLPELRQMAERYMRRERPEHTLQPTELVNEIFLKLSAARDRDWQDRGHFFAIAARAMRHCLIDYARARPNAAFVPVDKLFETAIGKEDPEFLFEIDRLLDELKGISPELCSIVELRYFLGLTADETAEVLGISSRTLQRRWQDARKWLFERMSEAGNAGT